MSTWRDKHRIVHQERKNAWLAETLRMLCGDVRTYRHRRSDSDVDCMACIAAGQEE